MSALERVQGPVIVDAEDQPLVMGRSWSRNKLGYAVHKSSRSVGGVRTQHAVSLHRLIVGAGHGLFVDHKNRDILDNRRCNLRTCTKAENNRNAVRAVTNETGYRGVKRKGNRYEAQITVDYRKVSLGHFGTAKEAAEAYDRAALEMHGAFATTNTLTHPEAPDAK
jgi:hypothetical protein